MADETQRDTRLGRRILVLRVASLGAAAGMVSAATAEAAPVVPPLAEAPGATPVQYRSDNDPNDAPGRGIRGGGYSGGRSDNDPNDAAGRGIRGGGGGGYNRGVTDNDPSDGPGRGRGWSNRRNVTDNDPSDGPGRGRGWR
jgi:hypothetical protein